MPIPFEPTRSYIYKASRYEILPNLVELAKGFGDTQFSLRELSKKLLAETYTAEQLEIRIKKQQSDRTDKISSIFGFYIPYLAENLHFFEYLGEGLFKNISVENSVAEADAEAIDETSDEKGIIYAYSFPTIINGEIFPIKIGLTVTGDVQNRVMQQCKQTCCFENPKILKTWDVENVAAVEKAIHATLEARGFKRDCPGNEWFNSSIKNIDEIIKFILRKN